MTRETAIKGLKAFRKEFSGYEPNEEMFDMAIQALEQEPTAKNNLGVDAVNREAVLDLIADYDLSMGQVVRGIHALPSITPQSKTGHWNDIPKYKDIAWQCSECGHFTTMKHNFCADCGCRMVEPQESEDV